MNKNEAKARIEAAEKELAAAKAALEQAQEPDGRVIMKPSEVPVGEYFRYVDDVYAWGRVCLKIDGSHHVTIGAKKSPSKSWLHDDYPVYLTDPYGNAIEPCEELPGDFSPKMVMSALDGCHIDVWAAFFFADTKDGTKYWEQFGRGTPLTSDAKAKLRGMIHKWNQENGGQG